MTAAVKKRPKYLDLAKIKQPIPAVVSILHRISGAVLFLFLPLGLVVLQSSLASGSGFAQWAAVLGNPVVKLIVIGLIWAYLHHFCAGIRYLLLDLHLGIDLKSARSTSFAVIGVSVVLTLLAATKLW